jgi:transglutaminase-like putative cysteine protease
MTRLFHLPTSPVEHSGVARAFVLGGFSVAVVAIVLYGNDYVVPVVALVAASVGHFVSYRDRNRGRELWQQALLASLIFAALLYVIADSTLALFGGVLPQANFAILLVAITSFDLKTRRNCYSSLWISLAILYLAAVYAWDYAFAVLAAAWLACLIGFWTASHLSRVHAEWGAPKRAATLLLATTLFAGLAWFVVVPQPSGVPISPLVISLPNFTGFKGDMEGAALPLVQLTGDATGATASVDLRYRGRLGDAPVMYVRTGAPAYWRGLVFDNYRGGVWTASDHFYRQTEPYVPPRLLPPPPINLGTLVQTFRVLRPMPGVIDAAYPIQSLYAPVAALREDAYGTFHTPTELQPGQTYSVVSYIPDLSPQLLRAGEQDTVLMQSGGLNLDYRALSDRARNLARSVAAGTTNEFDAVMAVTNYLQRSYRYTLDLPPVPAGRDPIDSFLFDSKSGYCEQFATAATLMLRSLNIPARLATGYATGDYNPVLNEAVVRERDAHAWVEVYFQGFGWVPVDPTPGVPALAATQFPNHWAAAGVARLIPHLTVGAPTKAIGSLGALAVVPAGVVMAVVLVLAYAWLRRHAWMRTRRPQPGESELLRMYERVQRRMRRRRAPPETPAEYREAMQSALLIEITDAVNEGVYAGRWPSHERLRALSEHVS